MEIHAHVPTIGKTASHWPGTGTGIFQTTTAYTDRNNTFAPGGRLGQLVFRLNW